MGKSLEDFYFKNGALIFAHIRVINYGSHIMDENLKEVVTEENKLFFAGDKLVRWLNPENQVLPSMLGYQEKEKNVLAEAKSFLLLMNTPPPREGEDLCNWTCVQKENENCVRYQCK
jgi:hypothetical protein